MNVVAEKWSRLVLWFRWHQRHLCPLPNKDPGKNVALQESVIKPRLAKRVMKIRELQREKDQIRKLRFDLLIKLREEEVSKNETAAGIHIRKRIKNLDKAFHEKGCELDAVYACYNYYWQLYQDANILDPTWGDKHQFLATYESYTATVFRRKDILTEM